MTFFRFTCTIYAFTTSIVDEQEVQGFSTTPTYSGVCNYWDVGNTGRVKDGVVIQDDFNIKMVDLPFIVNIPDFSKVVLDNGKQYKVVRSDNRPGITINRTLLTCERTDA